MEIFDHSSRCAFVRPHTDVRQEDLTLSFRLKSSVFFGVEVSQAHRHQTQSFMSLWTLLSAMVQSCWKRTWPDPNKVKQQLIKCALYKKIMSLNTCVLY